MSQELKVILPDRKTLKKTFKGVIQNNENLVNSLALGLAGWEVINGEALWNRLFFSVMGWMGEEKRNPAIVSIADSLLIFETEKWINILNVPQQLKDQALKYRDEYDAWLKSRKQ